MACAIVPPLKRVCVITPPERLNARQLCDVFRVAERWLALNREPVNAINVYPVPDGDTGTNMLLTLRASLAAAESSDGDGVGPFMRSMARGALLGARGNSGVILSQMIRGLADALDAVDEVDGRAMRDALDSASRVAYAAVSNPVEGTMLTVIREAAEAATIAYDADSTLSCVFDAAVEEARASVERTPSLLPQLAEAHVVDAGGLGVEVLLAGMRFGYRGDDLPEPMPTPVGAVELSSVQHEGHGYCTEFVVTGGELDRSALLRTLADAGGESLVVVGDASALHVHVHIDDPGPALSAGASSGALEAVKVENMQAQHDLWAAGHEVSEPEAPEALPELGLVVVAQGAGAAATFRELGATEIVDGGPTANPSAGQLLAAARRAGRTHVFLLPNDSNVTMAAEQAAAEEPGLITVIPTRSVAAGFGAALAYAPDGDQQAIAAEMRQQAEGIRTVEVTYAVRDTSADGVSVSAGDAIAMLDGTLVARSETLEDAMLQGLGRAVEGAELVTVYLGADAPPNASADVKRLILDAHDGLDVEVVDTGQPHYPYVLGVE